MNTRRAYRTLLRLYPWDYRTRFAAEMSNAFENAGEERGGRGGPVFVRFLFIELVGLILGAGAEWTAKMTTDRSVRGRCLPDLRMMRPPGVPRELWFIEPGLSRKKCELDGGGCDGCW